MGIGRSAIGTMLVESLDILMEVVKEGSAGDADIFYAPSCHLRC